MSIPEFGLSESMVLKGGRINGKQGRKGLARPSVGATDLEGGAARVAHRKSAGPVARGRRQEGPDRTQPSLTIEAHRLPPKARIRRAGSRDGNRVSRISRAGSRDGNRVSDSREVPGPPLRLRALVDGRVAHLVLARDLLDAELAGAVLALDGVPVGGAHQSRWRQIAQIAIARSRRHRLLGQRSHR
jgi:hypothetical protein